MKISSRTTHCSSTPKFDLPKTSRIIAPETTNTGIHLLFVKLVLVYASWSETRSHHGRLLRLLFSLETRCNLWLTLHR